MKQFLSILRFEYLGYIKNKVFMGITIAVIVILAVLLSLPRITALIGGDSEAESEPEATGETVLISCLLYTSRCV